MSGPSTEADLLEGAPETHFAAVLKNHRLNGGSVFELVRDFASISAARGVSIQKTLEEGGPTDASAAQELENYALETKLWDLFYMLQQFRLTQDEEPVHCHAYSSMSIKQRKYLQDHPNLRELVLITCWVQQNSDDIAAPENTLYPEKWANSRVALQNKNLASLTNTNALEYVDHLDVDAPLRSSKRIKAEDEDVDSENFFYIYHLILKGRFQEAVEYASQTGNFALALILVGAHQDYIDPLVDGDDYMAEDGQELDLSQPSGLKHKYMWLQSVYKLSQEKRVNSYESLIYSFLAGTDQLENIKAAGSNWDTCLLLYVNQLLTYHARTFLKDQLAQPGADQDQIESIIFPTPQHSSTRSILNTMEKSRSLSEESKNPFRVIMASIIIDQLHLFFQNTARSSQFTIFEDHHVLRVLAHLAVVVTMLDLHLGSKAATKIITRYVSRLSENGFDDLVPIYLSYIPDERDLRECYSAFLSTITESEKRHKQIEAFKRLGINSPVSVSNLLTDDTEDERQLRFSNVLKRTVERVMLETEPFYHSKPNLFFEELEVEPMDVKLYKSVEWFYETKMYEDAISSTLTVFRRFLATGRLKAVMEFSKEKNLKALVKDYDMDLHQRSLVDGTAATTITDSDKEELMQYDHLLDCLRLLNEWQSFVENSTESSWKSKDVDKSIEKTVSTVKTFINSCFVDLIKTSKNEVLVQQYRNLRTIYVAHFIFEIIRVLMDSKRQDWRYMRQALLLANEVADDKQNDFLECFVNSGQLGCFLSKISGASIELSKFGMKGIYV